MANIVFTDTGTSIKITFGDKSNIYGFKELEMPKNSTPLIVEEDDVNLSFYSNGDRTSIDFNDVDFPADIISASDLKNNLSALFFKSNIKTFTNIKSILLNGIDKDVRMASQPFINLFGAQWSISFWYNPGDSASKPTFGFTGSVTANADNCIASYDQQLNIGDGTTAQLIAPLSDAPANEWSHYLIVDDGTNYVRYRNGSQTHSDGITVNPASAPNRIFVLGQSGFDAPFNDFSGGNFDEFSIWKKGFNSTEAAALYSSGIVIDLKAHIDNASLVAWSRLGDKAVWNSIAWTFPDQINSFNNFISSKMEFIDVENVVP